MNQNSCPRAISDIDRWFNSEISRWRSGAALLWTVVLTGPVLYITLALSTLSLLHPLNWILEAVLRVFSPWTWYYLILVIVMVTILTSHSAKQLTVLGVVYGSRWEKLRAVLRVRNLYIVSASGLLTYGLVWCYTRLVSGQFAGITSPCGDNSEESCINEQHIFIVLHGVYVGVAYRIMSTITAQHHMVFPTVQQSKFFHLKSSILQMINRCLLTTLNRIKYFYLAYYLVLGSVIKGFMSTHLGIQQSPSEAAINSMRGILDVGLLWHCVWSGAMVTFLITLGVTIHKLYHTEWFQFAIETSVEKYKNLVLHQALACEHSPLVQYHGYQDLYILSKQSLPRRFQVFALTLLGGNPQNWQRISSQALGLLQQFIDQLAAYNTRIMADGSMKQLDIQPKNGEVRHRLVSGENTQPGVATDKSTKPARSNTLLSELKKTRVIGFFLAEDPDACSRKLFVKSQVYIWAVEAMSYLVCASYDEDKFGVVQKSLPNILTTLLTVQEQVEKHYRLVPTIGRREREDDEDSSLRGALRVTLKVAIYRIVARFNTHIRSVPLSSDHKRRLNHFLDYKE